MAGELEMRIRLVLEIYAMMCLIGLPAVLAMAVYLYKKTDFFSRLDERIDAIIGIPASGGADDSTDDTAQLPPAEDRPGGCIPRFTLQTGEKYRCWGKCGYKGWESENAFVGTVGEDNVFSALKAGSSPLLLDGVARFIIEVIPAHGRSFLDNDLADISSGAPFVSIKSRLRKASIIQGDIEDLPLIVSNLSTGILKTTYTQKDGVVDRVLYEMVDPSINIGQVMDERFRRIKTRGAVSVWYHLDKNDKVDAVAFARRTADAFLLGISSSWREDMEAAEAQINAVMIEKQFADLTGIPAAKVRLTEEEERRLVGPVKGSNDTLSEKPSQEEMETPETTAATDADETARGQFEPESQDNEPEELAIEPEGYDEDEEEPEVQSDEMPDASAFASEDEEFYDGPSAGEAPSFDM